MPVTQAHFSRPDLISSVVHDRQRDGRQQLVGDAEQREQLVDPAERVGHAGVEEVAPRADDDRARRPQARLPADAADRLPDVAERVLEHEAPDPGAGVHRGQDEQGLEHDREVVPEGLEAVPPVAPEKICDMPRPASARRRCARSASAPRPPSAAACSSPGRDREAEAVDGLRRRLDGVADHRRPARSSRSRGPGR